ncbi:polysaccharide biosynthesis C-terminal domain-containing protein [Lewinella sp. JB7]|uniref:polysaccharide biosynthesis C-terminal domain-containing protein n=1 Tax=Lewinella sp. JB7 TaxID=2962887 RepID=UPI0020C9D2C7|nr:polysaccharide biosynthesis C-terminal domain-containing protein [Lewinella sp. JB7]MCP9234694.1 polysaccharide biosynthesis C-terminal domain-containing protein [Lewinella sp. JB7]
MLATFFRNAVLVLLLNLTVKGVYLFAIERTVQNRLPEADYGLYFSLLGLGMLLQVIADFGLQLYNSRTISGHRQLLAKYFPHFILLKTLLGGVFFAALLLAGWGLGYRGAEIGLLLLIGTGQLLNSLVLYLRSSLAGLGRYALDSWFSILDKVCMIALIGTVLLFFPARLSIHFFAGAQVLCWLITAASLGILLRGKLVRRWPQFRPATLWMLLRGGAPFAIAILLQTAYSRADAIMIERLLVGGAEAAGHYAAGYRLLDAVNTVGWLLAGLLLPMYARLHARREGVTELLRFSVHLLVGGALVVSIAVAAYAGPIVGVLYDFAEPRTATILLFLALTFVAQCLNYAYGALLGATGLIGRMNYVFAVGILLNVAGNLWVLPRYGAPGAAAVTLLTQSFVAVVQAGLAHRWLHLPVGVVGWGRLGLLAVLLTGAAILLTSFGDLGWLTGFVLLGVGGLGLALLLRLISVRELTGFLRFR